MKYSTDNASMSESKHACTEILFKDVSISPIQFMSEKRKK